MPLSAICTQTHTLMQPFQCVLMVLPTYHCIHTHIRTFTHTYTCIMSDTLEEEQTTAPMHQSTILSHHTCTHKRAPKSHATTTLSQILKRREALEHARRQRRQLIVVDPPAQAHAGYECMCVCMHARMYVYIYVCSHACMYACRCRC